MLTRSPSNLSFTSETSSQQQSPALQPRYANSARRHFRHTTLDRCKACSETPAKVDLLLSHTRAAVSVLLILR